jgi:hypothetical protein
LKLSDEAENDLKSSQKEKDESQYVAVSFDAFSPGTAVQQFQTGRQFVPNTLPPQTAPTVHTPLHLIESIQQLQTAVEPNSRTATRSSSSDGRRCKRNLPTETHTPHASRLYYPVQERAADLAYTDNTYLPVAGRIVTLPIISVNCLAGLEEGVKKGEEGGKGCFYPAHQVTQARRKPYVAFYPGDFGSLGYLDAVNNDGNCFWGRNGNGRKVKTEMMGDSRAVFHVVKMHSTEQRNLHKSHKIDELHAYRVHSLPDQVPMQCRPEPKLDLGCSDFAIQSKLLLR